MNREDKKIHDFAVDCVNNCEDRTILKDSLLPTFHNLTEKDKGKVFCFLIGVIKQLKPTEKMK